MNFEELHVELNKLLGERVLYKRVAGNSLIFYFFGEPGDPNVRSIWLEPPWRYERGGRVVAGSYDIPYDEADFETKEEYRREFDRICGLSDALEKSELLSLKVDEASSDLTLEFSDGQRVRSFASSAFEMPAWTYRNVPRDLAVHVSPGGIEARELTKRS